MSKPLIGSGTASSAAATSPTVRLAAENLKKVTVTSETAGPGELERAAKSEKSEDPGV